MNLGSLHFTMGYCDEIPLALAHGILDQRRYHTADHKASSMLEDEQPQPKVKRILKKVRICARLDRPPIPVFCLTPAATHIRVLVVDVPWRPLK